MTYYSNFKSNLKNKSYFQKGRSLKKQRNKIILVFIVVMLWGGESFAQNPPGTVQLNSSKIGSKCGTFIDANEVTVLYWKDYLNWLGKEYGEETSQYKTMLPDSATCSQVYSANWEHPSCQNFPIVGISYEQAIAYCKWLTDRVNEMLKLKNKKYTVSYTLPTKTDFEEAYKQQKVKTNYKNITGIDWRKEKKGILAGIGDNAQELTIEKMILTGEESDVLFFQPFMESNAFIGFRCIAEIHE